MRGGQDRAFDVARELLGRVDKHGGMERARAVAAWREAAGAEVAGHAMGFAMRDAELMVYVDSAVWAAELSALSEYYRASVNEILGKEMVRDVRFAVSNRVEKNRAERQTEKEIRDEIRPEPVPVVPATELESMQIEQMAAGIKSAAVREAVVRAAIAHLEWKKGIAALNGPEAPREGSEGPKSASEH